MKITLPSSSTWMRSLTPMIRLMSWSITMIGTRFAADLAEECAELRGLAVVEPRGRLVQQQDRGSPASARAISTRRWWP